MVFLVEGEEASSLTSLGESIARAFNVVNKKEQNADRFELGEAVSVDLKPLSDWFPSWMGHFVALKTKKKDTICERNYRSTTR